MTMLKLLMRKWSRIEIEEEDWIEYTRRSTVDAIGQDGTCKDSMLEQDTQKNEMEIGTENCNFTE